MIPKWMDAQADPVFDYNYQVSILIVIFMSPVLKKTRSFHN